MPFLLCLVYYKKFINKVNKVFFLYTIFIAVSIIVGFSFLYIFNSPGNYYFVIRIYNVLEYTILAYLFSFYIKKKAVRKILYFSIIPFWVFCLYDFLTTKEVTLAFVPLIIEYFVLLVFIIYFFFEVMQETVVEPIYNKAIFWISVAFIINFSGNFFLFVYSKNSFNNEEFRRQYVIIYATVTIVKNILLCISILIKENQSTISPHHPIEIDLDPFHPIRNKT